MRGTSWWARASGRASGDSAHTVLCTPGSSIRSLTSATKRAWPCGGTGGRWRFLCRAPPPSCELPAELPRAAPAAPELLLPELRRPAVPELLLLLPWSRLLSRRDASSNEVAECRHRASSVAPAAPGWPRAAAAASATRRRPRPPPPPQGTAAPRPSRGQRGCCQPGQRPPARAEACRAQCSQAAPWRRKSQPRPCAACIAAGTRRRGELGRRGRDVPGRATLLSPCAGSADWQRRAVACRGAQAAAARHQARRAVRKQQTQSREQACCLRYRNSQAVECVVKGRCAPLRWNGAAHSGAGHIPAASGSARAEGRVRAASRYVRPCRAPALHGLAATCRRRAGCCWRSRRLPVPLRPDCCCSCWRMAPPPHSSTSDGHDRSEGSVPVSAASWWWWWWVGGWGGGWVWGGQGWGGHRQTRGVAGWLAGRPAGWLAGWSTAQPRHAPNNHSPQPHG